MRKESIMSIEPTQDAATKWHDDIQKMNEMTLYPLANSWYMGANIPGKKREMYNYLAGLATYEKTCRAAIQDWDGFTVVKE